MPPAIHRRMQVSAVAWGCWTGAARLGRGSPSNNVDAAEAAMVLRKSRGVQGPLYFGFNCCAIIGLALRIYSNDFDSVGSNPDILLIESCFQGFLDKAHRFPVFRDIVNINTHPDQLIGVKGTLIHPFATNNHCFRGGRFEKVKEFIVVIDDFLRRGSPTVVIKQRGYG